MKVCIASVHGINRGYSGIKTHCKWLMRYFDEQGVDYIYITPFSYYKFIVYPVFTVRYLFKRKFKLLSLIWFRKWHYYFLKKALARLLKRQKVDIINAQCPLGALAALKIRDNLGLNYKVILTAHLNGSEADELVMSGELRQGRYYKKIKEIEKFVFLNIDATVFVSQHLKDFINNRFPQFKNKLYTVIHHGIGYSRMYTKKDSSLSWPRRLKLLNVGSFELRKNQSFLIRVIKELIMKFPNIELCLIGNGTDKNKLKKLALSLGVKDNVQFEYAGANIDNYLKDSYVYIHSAIDESFGIALIEAMSWGIPVVSFSVGGIREIIISGYSGFLVEDRKVETYAKYIEELLVNKDIYQTMSANCLQTFSERFHYRVMGNRYLEFYSRV